MTIQQALSIGKEQLKKSKIEQPIQKARIGLASVLKVNKEYLMIHSEQELSKEQQEQYTKVIEHLVLHVPLQYITHQQEFMKLNFFVDENVLIPRADTEILVEEVLREN